MRDKARSIDGNVRDHSHTSIARTAARVFVLVVSQGLLYTDVHAAPFVLITPDEYASAGGAEAITSKDLEPLAPGAPDIRVVAPGDDNPVATPFSVKVNFTTHDDAKLDKSSLKIEYGMLHLDITSRILEHCTFSPTTLDVSEVVVPKGRHKLWLSVADDRGRRSMLSYVLVVR